MSRQKGNAYELKAKSYLESQGLIFLSQSYNACGGEVDLVMKEKQTFVFVEVKARSRICYGFGYEFVNVKKRQRIIRAAKHYLNQQRKPHLLNARFDVISIDNGVISWLKNAFYDESNF